MKLILVLLLLSLASFAQVNNVGVVTTLPSASTGVTGFIFVWTQASIPFTCPSGGGGGTGGSAIAICMTVDGSNWTSLGGPPCSATITTNCVPLNLLGVIYPWAALASGLLFNTTGTGAPSIANASQIPAPAGTGIVTATGGVFQAPAPLSGDISTSGAGTVTTLPNVNSNVGLCGDSTHSSQVTLNAKGQVTACAPVLISGAGSPPPGTPLYTQTADANVNNSTAETSIIGSGVGSLTTPANYFVAGTSLVLWSSGYFSSLVADTMNIKIKSGSAGTVVVGATGAFTPTAQTNAVFRLHTVVTCRTAGASGTFDVNTIMETTGSGLTPNEAKILNTSAIVLDTTGNLAWGLTVTWGGAGSPSASDTITATNFLMYSPGGTLLTGDVTDTAAGVTTISNNAVTTPKINNAAVTQAKIDATTLTAIGQKFFGTAAPGSVAGNLPGDLFSDTTNHHEYICNAVAGTVAPACTTVSSGGWQQVDGFTGILPESQGGTGANNTTGAAGHYLRSNGTHYVDGTIQAGDVPTLNQSTTGTAAGLSTILVESSGGTGANNTVGAAGHVLRSNGTHYVDAAIAAADLPAALSSSTSVNGTTIPASATLTRTIASGTVSLGTTTVNTGTCTAAIDGGTATGTLATDTVVATANADPTAVTGYTPATTGTLYVWAYPTADHTNFKLCNNTSSNITPGSAVTLNWKVLR
jgi:hypothetical protein